MVFISSTRYPWVPLEMTPFLTEWNLLLSFSVLLAVNDRRLPHARPLDPSRKLSLSCPWGDCGWLSYETYSVINRKAQTSTMPSTEKMRSMLLLR